MLLNRHPSLRKISKIGYVFSAETLTAGLPKNDEFLKSFFWLQRLGDFKGVLIFGGGTLPKTNMDTSNDGF